MDASPSPNNNNNNNPAPPPPPPPPQQPPPPPHQYSPLLSARSLKQLGLFCAGAGFLTASTLLARRAVARRQLAAVPKLFHTSYRPPDAPHVRSPEDSLLGLEALGLATLNVFSFGIMLSGGLAFAYDVSTLEDMRERTRAGMGLRGGGVADEEGEREVEEFMAKVMSWTKDEDKKGRMEREMSDLRREVAELKKRSAAAGGGDGEQQQ